MIYDVFTYNGEREILDLHLNITNPYVDKYIIVEAKTTFSGNYKPLYFSSQERYFEKFWPKIEYFIIDEEYNDVDRALAAASPNTQGAVHWQNEFLQKESIHKALIANEVQDEDTVYIGDVDEIWVPYIGDAFAAKLKLQVYAYYLDNRSSEEFWGTLVAKYGYLKDKCLNHLRASTTLRTKHDYGWHFTSMGGLNEVRRKLNDSYTAESYNTPSVQENLSKRHKQGVDYLGRDFTFKVDETEWPKYLRDHKKEYRDFLFPIPKP